MKKIKYNGSIAEDVQVLKESSRSSKRFLAGGVLGAIGSFVLVPLAGEVVALVGLGLSVVSLGTAVVKAINENKDMEEAGERLYKLFDAMHLDETVSEDNVKVVDVAMSVKNVNTYEVRPGKYVIIKEGTKSHLIRENESLTSEYLAYEQYLVDYADKLEAELVLKELSSSEDVVVLRK